MTFGRLLTAFSLLMFAAAANAADLTVRVDARETPRGILHVTQSFPVKAGSAAFSYPKWLPGEHGPTGPNVDVAGLVIRAGDRVLPWTRDGIDMNTVRVAVPAGTREVKLAFDFVLDNGTDGFTSAACSTPNLILLSWNQVAFYPAGKRSDDVTCEATLLLPGRWQYASALEARLTDADGIVFKPVTLTKLVDSPVLAGAHFRTVELTEPGDAAPVRLRMACDSEEGLKIPDSQVVALKKLVKEARALFGTEHYAHYDFLLSMSDHIAHFGLEHHESSDDRGHERWWIDDDLRRDASNLLAHEYVHSWNGKFRRPTGLATGDFFTPMQGELLWVYEGLTQYLGSVLAARSGLRTPEEARDNLATIAAQLQANRGRTWRPLVDTGTHAQELYEARGSWEHWRRSVDFYDEGQLLWLDVDGLIRKLSNNTKSMDDFCKRFHGGPNNGVELKPYTLEEIIATLNAVQPYDWKGFIQKRVYDVAPNAPTDGLTNGGWQLAWADSMGPLQRAHETAKKRVDESYTLGLTLTDDGHVRDIVPGSPADVAKIAPDMMVIAVNGRRYSKDVFRDAIAASKQRGVVELLCENKEFFGMYSVTYREGRRHPVLVRDASKPDYVSEALAPHAK